MKRLLVIITFCFFIAGCGTAARQSEFWEHPSIYQSWRHMGFSWCGYKAPTAEHVRKSQAEKWWGITVKVDQVKK